MAQGDHQHMHRGDRHGRRHRARSEPHPPGTAPGVVDGHPARDPRTTGQFISWTAEAIENPVVVRLVLDSGFDRTKPDSDPALVTLLTKVVDQAVESITVP